MEPMAKTGHDDGSLSRAGKSFLYYWRDYWEDRLLHPQARLRRLHQGSPVMERIRKGDSVWVIIRRRQDNQYVLVAHYLVSEAGMSPENDPDRDRGKWYLESEEAGITLF